ncbi:MAG TPA: response regulator [Deltaproteobacteria bacterium]|nr:response regulator [Deltaproteobacteria bacterium]
MISAATNFESLRQRTAASPGDNFLKGKTSRVGEVLIVDDEEPFVLSLADGLSVYKNFFNLRTAPNGAEAVKILKLSTIDLVITDLSMPKMDGFELLAYMNRNYPKIPVILMTAYGTPKIEEIVQNMGIFRYLEKPLDINSIADNIFDALGIKTSPAEALTQASDQKREAGSTQRFAISTEKMIPKPDDDAEPEAATKTSATFGSRTSISLSDLEKIKDEARKKQAAKGKAMKPSAAAEKDAADAAEKRAILEAKARAEAERIAREEAERKAQEAEEKAIQEARAREEAERKAREAEEKVEKARQEALAREEAMKRARAEAETQEKARQEALAREEAARKAKEKEAEEKARQEALAREEEVKKARAEEEAQEKARQEALAREEAARKAKDEEEAKEKARQEALAREEERNTRQQADAETKEAARKELKSETKERLSAWKK